MEFPSISSRLWQGFCLDNTSRDICSLGILWELFGSQSGLYDEKGGMEFTFLRCLLARGDNSSGSRMRGITEAGSGMWQMRHPGLWKVPRAFKRRNTHNSLRAAPRKPKQPSAAGGHDEHSRRLGIRVGRLGLGSCSDLRVVSKYFSIRCFLSAKGKIHSAFTQWSKLTLPILGQILMSWESR